MTMETQNLETLDEIDRRYILQVLDECGGNRTIASRILQLDRKTLYRKLVRWGLVQRL